MNIIKDVKKVIALTTSLSLVAFGAFVSLEPSDVQAQATDEVVVTLQVDEEITITSPADVSLTPNLGLSANSATGDVTWNVKTSSADGYSLSVAADSTPALQSASSSFDDFEVTLSGSPEAWNTSNAAEFGFSAFGSDINSGLWGSGSSCTDGGGSGEGDGNIPTDLNYHGFEGTTNLGIATGSGTTPSAGTDTTVCFAAEQESVLASSGTYTATITATATTG